MKRSMLHRDMELENVRECSVLGVLSISNVLTSLRVEHCGDEMHQDRDFLSWSYRRKKETRLDIACQQCSVCSVLNGEVRRSRGHRHALWSINKNTAHTLTKWSCRLGQHLQLSEHLPWVCVLSASRCYQLVDLLVEYLLRHVLLYLPWRYFPHISISLWSGNWKGETRMSS